MSWVLDAIYLLAGLILLPYWLWKLPQARRYRAGLRQRLGAAPLLAADRPRLWVHCASVGEASIPRRFIGQFEKRYPEWQVVFSTNTNTGAARLEELYPGTPVFYMPLDFSWCVRRSLRRVCPSAVLLVELEVWPNFLLACRSGGIPVAIINGRVSDRSRRSLALMRRFMPDIWQPVRVCCARGHEDAQAFQAAGYPRERLFTCGSLKYDSLRVRPDEQKVEHLRRLFNLSTGAPVLVAGSTHRGEESALAAVYRDLRLRHRDLRMILAPRHIERAADVAVTLQSRNLTVARKTTLEQSPTRARQDAVILVDTIGDLVDCYALADCVFVGRSLLSPGGGQNVMEPAALGKPVLTGPYTANFRREVELLVQRGAVRVVRNRRELTTEADRLLSDPKAAERMGSAGRAVIRQSKGATERTLAHLDALFCCP